MIIVTCFTPESLRPEAKQAVVDNWNGKWIWHNIPPGDPFAYGLVLKNYWQQKKDFAVIEPDIVIRKDVIDAFLTCEHEYCAFPYEWTTNVGPALGCTRFKASFLKKFPTAMQEAIDHGVGWRQLDAVLMRWVLAKKYHQQPHVHLPPVEHLNEGKKLVEGADSTPMMEVPLF